MGDPRNMAAAQHGVATIILVTDVDPKSKKCDLVLYTQAKVWFLVQILIRFRPSTPWPIVKVVPHFRAKGPN